MAISGFGNTPGNLRLGKSLTLGQNKQQGEVQKEEAKKEEPLKAETAPSKLSPGQLKFDQVDSLLIGRGIKINKPTQPEQPAMSLLGDLGDASGKDLGKFLRDGDAKHGDTFMQDGKAWKIINTATSGEYVKFICYCEETGLIQEIRTYG